jgi:hypothetical protein
VAEEEEEEEEAVAALSQQHWEWAALPPSAHA